LAFVIKRKITLVGDACFKLPIITRFHNLHVGNIKAVVGEIASYHERDWLFLFYSYDCMFFGLFLAFTFVFWVKVLTSFLPSLVHDGSF
jgi:hypothetical protein